MKVEHGGKFQGYIFHTQGRGYYFVSPQGQPRRYHETREAAIAALLRFNGAA